MTVDNWHKYKPVIASMFFADVLPSAWDVCLQDLDVEHEEAEQHGWSELRRQ